MKRPNRRDVLRLGALLAASSLAPAAVGAPASRAAEARAPRVGRRRRGRRRDRWASVRRDFELDDDWAHLAGMLIASHPRPVRQALEAHRRALDRNPGMALVDWRLQDLAVREEAAAYLGAEPGDVVLTFNTTSGLGLVYTAVKAREGQELLTSDHDYAASRDALELNARRTGATVRTITLHDDPLEVDADAAVERVLSAVGPSTRILTLTHVHSSTGLRIPVRRITREIARINADRDEDDRVIVGLDGAHSLGVLDFAVADLGVDFLMAGTHKWLLGPRGTGLVWGAPASRGAILPTIPTFTPEQGWGGILSPGGFHAFEHRWAVIEAFRYHLGLGKDRVEARIAALATQLKQGLAEMPHVRLVTPMSPEQSAGIVCFRVEGRLPSEVVEALRERRVVASATPYRPSHARLTPGIYTTETEIDRALEAVRALA